MLSGEHSRNNYKEQELKKQFLHSCKSTQYVKMCFIVSNLSQGMHIGGFSPINRQNEYKKKCDQHAFGIIHYPCGDIDHKTEWGHPLWVES